MKPVRPAIGLLAVVAVLFLCSCNRGENGAAERQDAAPASSEGGDITINLSGGASAPQQSSAFDPSAAPPLDAEPLTLAASPILFISGKADVSKEASTNALKVAYGKIRAFMAANHLSAAGAPIAITQDFNHETNVWSFRAGIPLTAAPSAVPPNADGIVLGQGYAGAAVRFVHHGDPNSAQATYAKITEWMRAHGFVETGPSWEEYVSDPASPLDQWTTNIYMPVG